MDQRSYLAKVDSALEGTRLAAAAFVDQSIELIRQELKRDYPAAVSAKSVCTDEIAFLRWMRDHRSKRSALMPARLFADPAWDILLELTLARLENREVTVKVIQGATMVPAATTLRWIGVLEAEDLLTRRHDPIDRRRTIVTLSEAGLEAMSKWLEGVMPVEKD